MTTILGLSGSLRRVSFNTGLLYAAAELPADGVTIQISSIRKVPLYDADLEAGCRIRFLLCRINLPAPMAC